MGSLRLVEVDWETLKRVCRKADNIRLGATIDPDKRAKQYENNGANGNYFGGKMLYCRKSDARAAEDRLFQIADYYGVAELNIHRVSNYKQIPAYVYVIRGFFIDGSYSYGYPDNDTHYHHQNPDGWHVDIQCQCSIM